MPTDAPAVRYITVWPGPRKVRYVREDLFEEALRMAEDVALSHPKYRYDADTVDRLAKLRALLDGKGAGGGA